MKQSEKYIAITITKWYWPKTFSKSNIFRIKISRINHEYHHHRIEATVSFLKELFKKHKENQKTPKQEQKETHLYSNSKEIMCSVDRMLQDI